MAKRFVMRIELNSGSRAKVSALSKRLGMTQLALVSKLVDWFATQDETVQAACLGLYPEAVRDDIARLILTKMAKSSRKARHFN